MKSSKKTVFKSFFSEKQDTSKMYGLSINLLTLKKHFRSLNVICACLLQNKLE